jgi:SpoVK/Ycf46/Vps4 family AAA+-type ATPase
MDSAAVIRSLSAAVAAAPDDHALRLHLAELLIDADSPELALPHVSHVLAADSSNPSANELLRRAAAALASPARPAAATGFDWAAAEQEVVDLAPPMFIEHGGVTEDASTAQRDVLDDLERPTLRLADIGGMQHVKSRLEAAFLAPLNNPTLRGLYGKSLRGGLLLYGPPGCGKTFIARALAGELEAGFYSISLADVLDMYIGQSERNLHAIFETVRRHAPCVLFLDEIDALGQKRTHLRGSAMRGTVNQLLTELDGISAANDGVFVLAASNHPWDIDSALRRPGRLDRMLLVLPPDDAGRESVLRHHLQDRPIAGIDVRKLASRTRGFSGADLAHLCDAAAEAALLDSVQSGTARMIQMTDFDNALTEIKPSTGAWFETAKNVAMFANESGEYDELVKYLREQKLV